MSAGHAYREDGWCRAPRCLRHRDDPPDFGLCPDTEGGTLRHALPPDKERAHALRWGKLLALLFK